MYYFVAHQTFGDMLRWNLHFHSIVLQGGFDEQGTFFYIAFSGLLSWKHSGFSIDNSVSILDEFSQESPDEYIARPPILLKKIRYEPFKGQVLFHITYSEYFKQNLHIFDAVDFLVELTQHIPAKRLQLIRRYGLYAFHTKGRWEEMPWVGERAPEGWKAAHQHGAAGEDLAYEPLSDDDQEADVNARKRTWARLLAKVYEVDPLVCPQCGAEMNVIAIIEDPDELKRIFRHLVKFGRSPPNFDPTRLN